MVARRERPETGREESKMIDEVTERVFMNYEPPQPEDPEQEDEKEEEGTTRESAA
jgi:hypothetical protein